MIEHPRFKPQFRIEVVEPDAVFLLSERADFLLTGRLYTRLAPLLDGSRTPDELAEMLAGEAPASEVYYALMLMEKRGYLIEAVPLPEPVAAWWGLLEVDPATAAARLREGAVALSSLEPRAGEQMRALLFGQGIDVRDDGALRVVLTDDYLRPELEAVNRAAIETGRAWMPVRTTGATVAVGPIFLPGRTGCWACLAHRLRGHRNVEQFLQARHGTASPFPATHAALPSTELTALSLAATEVARFLVQGEGSRLVGQAVTFDTTTLEVQHHRLVRRPQCPVCGAGTPEVTREPVPPLLQSRKKVTREGGGHRTATPEETLRRLEHHVSPLTGVVRSLQRAPVGAEGEGVVNTYLAGHNVARMGDELFFLRQSLRSRAGGKGRTDLLARTSALCESLERYSGIFQGDEPRIEASYLELGDRAIHPNTMLGFSARQYRERAAWNAHCNPAHLVPEPFDETRVVEWSPVWSLARGRWAYLPTACCYYGYRQETARFCRADSNGNASGNSLEEAIVHGFLELVERDCAAIWWYNRLSMPGVDLEAFDDPYLRQLSAYYRSIGRELWAIDLTNDLGIPVIAAVSRRIDKPAEDIIYAFGAHFDARVALTRAVTEVNQMLMMVADEFLSSAARNPDNETVNWKRWCKTVTVAAEPWLVPAADRPARVPSGFPAHETTDLLEDLQACVRLAERHGMETFVLDQTRPDIGMPVVKVIVPGMRHFWPRFAPGRLYDVPVTMGYLEAPLREDQLNPIPIYI